MNWIVSGLGAEVARGALKTLGVIEKAKKNPLHPKGFDQMVKKLARGMVLGTRALDDAAMKTVVKSLERDWKNIPEGERGRIIDNAVQTIGQAAGKVAPKVDKVLKTEGPAIVLSTKAATKERFGLRIGAGFNTVDAKVIDQARKSQAHFIRNEYGERQRRASQLARDVVADGLEQGLDRYDIGDERETKMVAAGVNRATSYWQNVASIFTARARSYGQVAGFDEAGIKAYRFDAVMDEVTTEQCRFLDGRVFDVSRGLQRYADVARSDDPEAVVDLQPFVRRGADEDGEFLFVEKGGERVQLARVERSAVGERDRAGRYSGELSDGELEALGVQMPPLHGNCRSTVVPEF